LFRSRLCFPDAKPERRARDEAPLASIAERLRAKGEGEVSPVAMLGTRDGEIEVKLPGRYAVTRALAGALKAVAGVVAVEHV
jgi:DNA polymerase-3 subunit alpha